MVDNTNEINEAVAEVDTSMTNNDELQDAIEKTLTKLRSDSMLVGYRVACKVVIDMIAPWHNPNCSHREYERIFKKLEEFCGKALQKSDKELGLFELETVQN